MNRWKRAIYNFGIFNSRTKHIIHKAIVNGELWYESMKEIEGHFGGGVGTYFQFLRFLFVLNFLSMVTVVGFVFLDGSSNHLLPHHFQHLSTFRFIVLPQILKNYLNSDNDRQIFTAAYDTLTNLIDFMTAEVSVN